jgi:hypothetical protein
MRTLAIIFSAALALTFWTIISMQLSVFVELHESVPVYLYCVPALAGALVFIVLCLNQGPIHLGSIKAWLLAALRLLAVAAIFISLFYVVVVYKSRRVDFIKVETRNISAFNLNEMQRRLGFKIYIALDKNDIKIYFLKENGRRYLVQVEAQKEMGAVKNN